MKKVLVTVVDILGIFTPGALLLIAIISVHPIFRQLSAEPWIRSMLTSITWLAVGVSAIIAYVLGFLLRLCSIRLLETATFEKWAPRLFVRATCLEPIIEQSLNNSVLCSCLKNEALCLKSYNAAFYAPYFPFMKRIVRSKPMIWAETERLEAEIRFAAGLVIPLAVFTFSGLIRITFLGDYIYGVPLTCVAAGGLLTIYSTFPSRRIREVMYNYYLGLIVMSYMTPLVDNSANLRAMSEEDE